MNLLHITSVFSEGGVFDMYIRDICYVFVFNKF